MLTPLRFILFGGALASAMPMVAFAAQDAASGNSSRGGESSGSSSSASSAVMVATDPSYRLNEGDTISITISTRSNQVESSATQTIAHSGDVRLPWIEKEVALAGKTVRDAERYLEKLYREGGFLKSPVVGLKVAAYFPREISVLGAVAHPGTIPFPADMTSLDIVKVITSAGGFSPIAKQDSVTVTHREDNGQEKVQTLNLEGIISGRRKAGRDTAEFLIFPGDRIYVPERIF